MKETTGWGGGMWDARAALEWMRLSNTSKLTSDLTQTRALLTLRVHDEASSFRAAWQNMECLASSSQRADFHGSIQYRPASSLCTWCCEGRHVCALFLPFL